MKLMPPEPTEEMLLAIRAFCQKTMNGKHPDVPFQGTANGDTLEKWLKRLDTALYKEVYAAAPNIEHEEIAKLKREKEMLVEAVSKASAHVRPTCVELYDYLQKALEKVKG